MARSRDQMDLDGQVIVCISTPQLEGFLGEVGRVREGVSCAPNELGSSIRRPVLCGRCRWILIVAVVVLVLVTLALISVYPDPQ